MIKIHKKRFAVYGLHLSGEKSEIEDLPGVCKTLTVVWHFFQSSLIIMIGNNNVVH